MLPLFIIVRLPFFMTLQCPFLSPALFIADKRQLLIIVTHWPIATFNYGLLPLSITGLLSLIMLLKTVEVTFCFAITPLSTSDRPFCFFVYIFN
jgi:hypothetical protein